MPEITTLGSAAPGTVVSSGSLITPSGDQGPVGTPGSQGIAGDAMAIGSILMYGSTTAPAGWMICDGSAISRATYPALFTLIGTTFGPGDGSTTFNLPDLRSRVGVGAGAGTGLTSRALAATGGEETHQLSIAELASHTHTVIDPQHAHNITNFYQYVGTGGTTNPAGLAGGPWGGVTITSNGALTGITNANTGSGTAHNTMPPFVVLAFIIKVSMGGGPTAQAPIADSTQSGLLRQVSGKTTDFVDGTNNCQDLPTAVRSAMSIIQVRNFNALGNPNFEIDARTVGAGSANGFALDRWSWGKVGGTTMAATAVQTDASAAPILLPGTNFAITSKFLRITLTAQQASLAAGDILYLYQFLEGIRLRELIGDVHSVSLLVRSSVAGLTFGMALRDATASRSLAKLCTIPSAGAWTTISLPALPIWPSGGSFSLAPGNVAYSLCVGLACGSTYVAPANNVWQTGNFVGAAGQSNFAAQAVNSTFDIAFIQHEPGSVCNPFIDLPWHDNLFACQRYFQKSVAYTTPPTSVGHYTNFSTVTNSAAVGELSFNPRMAKTPTMVLYNASNWAANQCYMHNPANPYNAVVGAGDSAGMTWLNNSANNFPVGQVAYQVGFGWTADTGW